MKTRLLCIGLTIIGLSAPLIIAQEVDGRNDHQGETAIADELIRLKAEVNRLNAALKSGHQPTPEAEQDHSAHQQQSDSGAASAQKKPKMDMGKGMKMGGMSDMKGMGKGMMGGMDGMMMKGMKMDKGMMGGMDGMMKGMKMDKGMMGGMDGMMKGMKMDMGMMGGGMMSGMKMDKGMMRQGMMGKTPDEALSQSVLPGFPGASHIYHIGAADFFLDHADHLTLSSDQLTQINQVKEKTLLSQRDYDRKIEQAEQDLWSLTAEDSPDIGKIESKLREIGAHQTDQRIAFIRGVGESAEALSVDQRKLLTGQKQSGAEPGGSDPAAHQH